MKAAVLALVLCAPVLAEKLPIEAKMIDGSVMQFDLIAEPLELVTPYGTLKVPLSAVRKIELAPRADKGEDTRIAAAIENLGHPDEKVRAQAEADLKSVGARAYPALLKAASGTNAAAARHAIALSREMPGLAEGIDAAPRASDVIETVDARLSGRLAADTLTVRAMAFGEQQLKLANVDELRSRTAAPEPDRPEPKTGRRALIEYARQFGVEKVLLVSGYTPPPSRRTYAAGGTWGTDVYTLDSDVSIAAVHAGVLQPGQSGFVRVRVVESPAAFKGSARNGITTSDYGAYPSGAFEFVR